MYDRFEFPKGLIRVTAGEGGEAFLIAGSEKTALYDCGMAYAGDALVSNIQEALKTLGRDAVDVVLISHSHYDHVGALAYVLRQWPEAVVYGAEKAKSVFASENAAAFMKKMSENARDLYSDSREELYMEGMRVDVAVKDGDFIDLGEKQIRVLETKGHTDCSLTFIIEPDSIMLASETTGVYISKEVMCTAILKSYAQSIESAKKCREAKPKYIVSPHYGFISEQTSDEYFDLFIKFADQAKDLICKLIEEGKDDKEILEKYEEVFWPISIGQIKMAFLTNAEACIRAIRKEFFSK